MRTCVRMDRRTPSPRGPRAAPLQLELGAADRLAALIEESGEPLAPERAAGALLALPRVPGELARRVLEEVVRDDARLVSHDDGRVGLVGLAPPPSTPLARAVWTVVDLETTGVGASARIVEIGAVRLEGGEQTGTLSRLVDPGLPMPPRITQITGIRDRDLAGAGPLRPALAEFLRLARGSVLVAHNAAFDVGMLDRALMRLDGTRIGMRVLDTVGLARRLLAGRIARFDLASVSDRFDVTVRPCHRALPDALATAEVLLGLIGLAQERGAESAEDVMALALAAPRRARQRRYLATGLPTGPGVYVMRDRLGQALYFGKAGDLRTRVRSYFGSRRQPPRIEGALAALAAIDAAPTGSELEAALAELDLIRRWRPPGNVRDARPDKSVYLRLALAEHAPALGLRTAVREDGAHYAGPFPSRRLATEAAEALRDGYRLRTCRPRLPVDDGRCLRGAAGRCLAHCRGGDDAVAYVRSARALAAWLAGEEAVLDAPPRAPGRAAALRGRRAHHAPAGCPPPRRCADLDHPARPSPDGRPARVRPGPASRRRLRGRARCTGGQAPPAAAGRRGTRARRRCGRPGTRVRSCRGARAAGGGPLAARGALLRRAPARTGLRRTRARGGAGR